MESNKALGTAKISKLLKKFSIPCIASLLISALYNIVDQIFIGNSSLGYLGNAATSIVFPIIIISYAFAWCFGDGAVALMSIRQGQKDDKGISKIIGNALLANLVASIIFMAICFIFMTPLLNVFGASAASFPLAKSYFTIILYASTASMANGVLSGIIRADGNPAFSMIMNVVGAVINIILDPIFIFTLDMGIEGAAYATIIAQIISFSIGLLYIFTKSKTFKLQLASFKPDLKIIAQSTKLGISTFITQISIVVTALVVNIMLVKYGESSIYGTDIPIAAMGITMKVLSIIINIAIGLIVGAQPILGYNYGAGNYDRVRETFKIVIKCTVMVGIVATVIFQIFPDLIINIFGSQDALYMDFSRKLFRIFMMLISFTILAKVISIFFQSVGNPAKATIVSLTRDIVCFVPFCIILPIFFGIDGVLYAAPLADLVGITVAGVFAVQFYRELVKQDQESKISESAADTIIDSKPGIIITIAREHGSAGKEIGRLLAKELGIPFYYKEMLAVAAKKSGLSEKYLNDINSRDDSKIMHELYLGSAPAEYAIKAQRQAIEEIAKHGSCVIVGRAADYVLRKNKNILRVFISAPEAYKVKKLKEMYGDNPIKARQSIKKSDHNRASYYNTISGLEWGKRGNYDLCIDSSIGNQATAKIISAYAQDFQRDI